MTLPLRGKIRGGVLVLAVLLALSYSAPARGHYLTRKQADRAALRAIDGPCGKGKWWTCAPPSERANCFRRFPGGHSWECRPSYVEQHVPDADLHRECWAWSGSDGFVLYLYHWTPVFYFDSCHGREWGW